MGIVVNVSAKEQAAGTFEPIPAGWYTCTISDGELVESKSTKNKGKPMYELQFTVNEGQHEGRKVRTFACLWSGALYTIVNLMKALGYEVEEGDLEVPEIDELLGRDVLVKVAKTPKRTVTAPDGSTKEYDEGNEVKGFKAIEDQEGVQQDALASLMP